MEAERLSAFPSSCEAAFTPLAAEGVLAADQKGITRLRLALRAAAKGNVVSLRSARTPSGFYSQQVAHPKGPSS